MQNNQLLDDHSLVFMVFFFILIFAGRNHATLKCKSGAFVFKEARLSFIVKAYAAYFHFDPLVRVDPEFRVREGRVIKKVNLSTFVNR